MYEIGTRVFVKSLDRVGTVTERNRLNRRASYLVELMPGFDFLTGSSDLRRADFCCDACSRHLPHGSKFSSGGIGDEILTFCFLCAGPPAQREYEREHFLEFLRERA